MKHFWDIQLLTVLTVVALCSGVLIRRAMKALQGDKVGCGHCPQSPDNAEQPIRARALTQIQIPPNGQGRNNYPPKSSEQW